MKLSAVAAILATGLLGLTAACSGPASGEKPAEGAKALAASGAIGIAECDDYMTKYRECIESKVPDAVKATVRQSLDQTTTAWKQAATTPEARAGLAQACKQATDAAKAAMQAYGCSF